ncbi:MAG: hypothetical protein O8C61_07960 [Candidatus Methanoperedens sp.]|nr:hypothetical protein [Candidatus Methanoperedens sp.]
MKNISKKKLAFIALAVLAVCAIIVLALFAPLQRTAGVHIGFSIGSSQGAAGNNTGIEIIKMKGSFWNYGDISARNLTATVIFTDTAHNKIVRKTIQEGIDLPPKEEQIIEFYSEYSREITIPKTGVKYNDPVRLEGKWAVKNYFNACAFCTILTIRKIKRRNKMSFAEKMITTTVNTKNVARKRGFKYD